MHVAKKHSVRKPHGVSAKFLLMGHGTSPSPAFPKESPSPRDLAANRTSPAPPQAINLRIKARKTKLCRGAQAEQAGLRPSPAEIGPWRARSFLNGEERQGRRTRAGLFSAF